MLIFFNLLMNMILKQPFLLIVNLIALNLSVVWIFSTMGFSLWLQYFIFLVYVGGIMIIFMYISSINPNLFTGKINILPLLPFFILWPVSLQFMTYNTANFKICMKFNLSSSLQILMVYLIVGLFSIFLIIGKMKTPLN